MLIFRVAPAARLCTLSISNDHCLLLLLLQDLRTLAVRPWSVRSSFHITLPQQYYPQRCPLLSPLTQAAISFPTTTLLDQTHSAAMLPRTEQSTTIGHAGPSLDFPSPPLLQPVCTEPLRHKRTFVPFALFARHSAPRRISRN